MADPEAVRKYQRELHKKNREHNCAKMRSYYARRFFWGRAMKLRQENRANYRDLASIWKFQRGLCALTGEKLTRENAHLDHITPITRGGGDEKENLRWLTKKANLIKRDLTDEELVMFCANVMRWLGDRIELVDKIPAGKTLER
jgi:5-methylcytosine-specific restriction endonuclease McrA